MGSFLLPLARIRYVKLPATSLLELAVAQRAELKFEAG